MTDARAWQESLELADRAPTLMLTTLDADGYPRTRAMLNMGHEELREFWFTTNTSSHKVAQIKADSRACVYLVGDTDYRGLSLIGRIEVLEDAPSRERLWREGFEMYYPQGVTDPDYAVLRFVAEHGEYYRGLHVARFDFA